MNKILISPYSRKLPTGTNAKNYPYWNEVTLTLQNKHNCHIIQIAETKECQINANELITPNLKELKTLVKDCTTWISIDNFFHHFCTLEKKRGVVIFGKSDPAIFGHPININLLKDRSYLRPDQFNIWAGVKHEPEVFVAPDVVVNATLSLINAYTKGN